MSDALLETRVRELSRVMQRMVMPWHKDRGFLDGQADWGFQVVLPDEQHLLSDEIRQTLEGLLEDDAREVHADLSDLADRLESLGAPDVGEDERESELVTLWARYRDAERRCNRLFQEFVELIGGLAFRDRTQDEWFFKTADHLMRVCAQQVQDHSYRTVALPGMHDTIRSGLAQLIRLRFPDWTVWALPLAAFGFGRTYITGRRDKPKRIRRKIQERLELDPDEPLDRDVETLLADVFATGAMGPAYALAAMRLRLTPEDNDRAYSILHTLELLGPHDADLLQGLREEWESCVAVTPPTQAEHDALKERVDQVFSVYQIYLRESARYPEGKWTNATWLLDRWSQLYEADPTEAPHVPPGERAHIHVPEVLNAAWFGRWQGATRKGQEWKDDDLAEAARRACIEILFAETQADPAPARVGGQSAGSRLAHGSRPQDFGRGDAARYAR